MASSRPETQTRSSRRSGARPDRAAFGPLFLPGERASATLPLAYSPRGGASARSIVPGVQRMPGAIPDDALGTGALATEAVRPAAPPCRASSRCRARSEPLRPQVSPLRWPAAPSSLPRESPGREPSEPDLRNRLLDLPFFLAPLALLGQLPRHRICLILLILRFFRRTLNCSLHRTHLRGASRRAFEARPPGAPRRADGDAPVQSAREALLEAPTSRVGVGVSGPQGRNRHAYLLAVRHGPRSRKHEESRASRSLSNARHRAVRSDAPSCRRSGRDLAAPATATALPAFSRLPTALSSQPPSRLLIHPTNRAPDQPTSRQHGLSEPLSRNRQRVLRAKQTRLVRTSETSNHSLASAISLEKRIKGRAEGLW